MTEVQDQIEGSILDERDPAAERSRAKRIIEALLFASTHPVPLNKLRTIVSQEQPLRGSELREILDEMREEFDNQERAYQLEEIAEGFTLRTRREYGSYVEELLGAPKAERLSPAATEVLAIIAYRQPITRPQIEALRGVDSSGVLHSLLERELVEAVGKLEAPGRPTLYGVSKNFLEHFGLRSVEDLPPFPEEKPDE